MMIPKTAKIITARTKNPNSKNMTMQSGMLQCCHIMLRRAVPVILVIHISERVTLTTKMKYSGYTGLMVFKLNSNH